MSRIRSPEYIAQRQAEVAQWHDDVQAFEDECRQKAASKGIRIAYEIKKLNPPSENDQCILHVGNETFIRLLTKKAPTESLYQMWEDDARYSLYEDAHKVLFGADGQN